MKKKLLKIWIYGLGIFALYIFIAIRFKPLREAILIEEELVRTKDEGRYGGLYYLNLITYFKDEKIPKQKYKYLQNSKKVEIENADIIAFGDSFFGYLDQKSVLQTLQDTLNGKIYFSKHIFPLTYFNKIAFSNTTPKQILFGIAEKNIPLLFEVPHNATKTSQNKQTIKDTYTKIINKIFYYYSEELYYELLKYSIFSHKIFETMVTIRFDYFKYINDNTPLYKLNHKNSPWLFDKREVNNKKTSFYYIHSKQEINTICKHISDMTNDLKEYYNLELIFVPIPNKYTIHHTILNQDEYNDFLPKIYDGLRQRKVNFVNLYTPFLNSDELLYYGTDNHWNENGIKIAVREIVRTLNKTPLTINYF